MWVYFPYKSTYQEGLVNGQLESREIDEFNIELKSMLGCEAVLKTLSKDDAKTLKTQITRFMEYLKDAGVKFQVMENGIHSGVRFLDPNESFDVIIAHRISPGSLTFEQFAAQAAKTYGFNLGEKFPVLKQVIDKIEIETIKENERIKKRMAMRKAAEDGKKELKPTISNDSSVSAGEKATNSANSQISTPEKPKHPKSWFKKPW